MFSDDQVYCVIDYETFSEAPLKKVGSFEYASHPSTKVLCVAWRIGTKATLQKAVSQIWSPLAPSSSIQILLSALANSDVVLVAHNALFEQVITEKVLARDLHTQHYLGCIPRSRWTCTAALASTLALPRKLEHVAKVLKLPQQKDMAGHKVMQKWTKPRKPSKNNPKTRHDDPDELQKVLEYCRQDVDVEVELFLRLPPLSEFERKIWLLDQKINLHGFLVDRPLVKKILGMIEDEVKYLNRRTVKVTNGALKSATQRNAVLEFLRKNGAYIPNLQKKTVEDILATNMVTGKAREILEIRQAISKTSTAKYLAFESRSRSDSRLRDILIYHGSSTGRWAGAGVQPQNLAKPSIADTDQAAKVLSTGDLEYVRLLYGKPMTVFSSCLRSMIIAPGGKTLDVADYAGIEARVLFWLADHEDGVAAFVQERDLYRELSAKIYGVETHEVTDKQRFLGKQATLGCGYSMGHKKFAATCKQYGQEIDEGLAKRAVDAYRLAHFPVTEFWSNVNTAAIAAVENPGRTYGANHTEWTKKGQYLWCRLPSGRRLAYFGPRVSYEPNPWGDKQPLLSHWGVDSLSKKWVLQKTYGGKLVENIVQATARDLMAEAMLRIEGHGSWKIVLSVHDELVAERQISPYYTQKDFCRLMAEVPKWAEGCPIKVEGWTGKRYKK